MPDRVAVRPCGVRSRKPNCSRYGSTTSMIVSGSSLIEAAIVLNPTGPPAIFLDHRAQHPPVDIIQTAMVHIHQIQRLAGNLPG